MNKQTQTGAPEHPLDVEQIQAMREILAFLDGRGTLDGCWFGDAPADAPGVYWWRSRLRERWGALLDAFREREEVLAHLEDELDAVRTVADAMEGALDVAKVPEMPGWTPDTRIRWLLESCGHANALLRQARELMPKERPPYTRWDAISDHIDRHLANIDRLKREHPPEEKEPRAEEAARLAAVRSLTRKEEPRA